MTKHKLKPDFEPLYFEHQAWSTGKILYGIDEVGRGCLAGPLVTAAVALKPYAHHALLRDSKLLSPQQRLRVYTWLLDNCQFSVSFMHHRAIDTHTIYQATLLAMCRAAVQLLACTPKKPAHILVDAMPLCFTDPELTKLSVLYFSQGESLSSSIAAASIIAKVTRDMLMQRLDITIPDYNLAQHKGYGTLLHRQALSKHNRSIMHRKSFLKNFALQ